MRTVIRPLVPRMEYGLRPVMGRIPYSFVFMACFFFSLNISSAQRQSVSCYSNINISINNEVPTRLGLSTLTPMTDITDLEVIIEDRPTLEFTCFDVGKVIMVTLRDLRDTVENNRCMVAIHVEDKTPLEISCRDTAITCLERALPDQSFLLQVISSCDDLSGTTVTYNDSPTTTFPADSDTLESFVRTWSVTDAIGNVINCQNTIYLRRFDLGLITFPQDIDIYCGQDPADMSITGSINYDPLLLADNCGIGVSSTFSDPLTGACYPKSKYKRIWTAMDWSSGVIRRDTQYIILHDTLPTIVTAPTGFTTIQQGCSTGIILGPPTIELNCTEVLLQDIEVRLDGSIYEVGDTAIVMPGTYDIIYGGTPLCIDIVRPDTAQLTIDDTINPTLECDSIKDLSISLMDGMSILIDLDSVFKNIPITFCSTPTTIIGRKLIPACTGDDGSYMSMLELCPAELLSGMMPGTIQIEIRALDSNGFMSDPCVVNIDVQEKVAPVIIPFDDIEVSLDNDDMMFTLDTNVIIASLTDNSGCISSLTMTGSGIGTTTGSGLPIFNNGNFITFDCSHAGMYDIAIFATDCDNNMDTAFTTLTVDPEGVCTSPSSIAGQILVADLMPMTKVEVELSTEGIPVMQLTDNDGRFSFPSNYSNKDPYEIRVNHNDAWASGLTVIDMKMIKDYILGTESLNQWQLAAADIDDNGSITAMDLIMIKKLILGLLSKDLTEDRMPWIFSNSDMTAAFDDHYVYQSSGDVEAPILITSTKLGDVNGDIMGQALVRSTRDLEIGYSHVSEHVTRYVIDLSADAGMSAIQFSLSVDEGRLTNIQGPEGTVWPTEEGIDMLYFDGMLGMESLPIVTFEVIHDNDQSHGISLGHNVGAFWYDHEDMPSSIRLVPKSLDRKENEIVCAISASPNPTTDRTRLQLEGRLADESADLSIQLYDMQGRLVFKDQWFQASPTQIFPFELPPLPHNGMFIAQVRINETTNAVYIIKK